MIMETKFDAPLVILSVLVAIFASYVALNLANNVTQAKGRAQALWLGAGALAMGTGIWSMHFIGMLAFEMPGMAMYYDVPLMVLSIVVAIGASALALYIVSRSSVPFPSLISGGVLMAAAIAGMHYIGMYSMRMAATIEWNVLLVVLSVVIALVASFSALFILIRLRNNDQPLKLFLAGTLMGFAISGMHYTGMFAATFIHADDHNIDNSNLLVTSGLTIAVVSTTLLILGVALISSVGQRIWTKRSKKAKEVLGTSEEKFRRLVEAVKDYAIIILDPAGFITTWNLGAQRITGYSNDEVIGKHISILYTEKDVADLTADKELKIATETGHFEMDLQRKRKDGSIYWASIVIAPLYDQEGKMTGFSKITRDITQFIESEKRMKHLNEELENRVMLRTQTLEMREKQLRTITDALPVLIAEFDHEERLLFANEAFCNWFQQNADEISGKKFCDILGPDRYVHNEPYIKKALSGEMANYERESKSGDMTAIFGITFVPEFNDQQKVVGLIVLATNITKHKEIQAELMHAKEAAEVANAAKSSFLANMSHEIRTPLGAVIGFSELLIDDKLSPSERFNSLEVIKRNGRLLSNIINDILDLSKVEAGKLDIEKVNTPISEIMNEIGSVLTLEAAAKGIELKVTAEGVIPSEIKTDPLRLRQILINIVGNAIKFTNRGEVKVKIKLLPSIKGITKLAFIVQDTGIGIEPEKVKRLFMPFSQADSSTTRKFGGTGLGLVLSKKLANALGGDVVLSETSIDNGSTFTITIDPEIQEKVLFESGSFSTTNIIPISKKQPERSLSRLKILLVDDSPDNLLLIKKILTLVGAQVETAVNGREAVNKAIKGNFSLILMDLQMPEMDGYEATRILREQGYNKPIIALTAHAMREEHQRSLQSGFNNHITKPVDQEALIQTLSMYSA